jgi:hypothetical protein
MYEDKYTGYTNISDTEYLTYIDLKFDSVLLT